MRTLWLCLTIAAAGPLGSGCTPSPASKAAPSVPLRGTSWQLVELNGKPLPAAPGLHIPTLRLDAPSGQATGTSGINRYSAGYELTPGSLTFRTGPSMRTTDGPPGAMAVEGDFLKALASVSSWYITGDELVLKSADKTVLRFRGE